MAHGDTRGVEEVKGKLALLAAQCELQAANVRSLNGPSRAVFLQAPAPQAGNCDVLNVIGIASTLHTTSKHGVSSITTADAHTSAASSRLN